MGTVYHENKNFFIRFFHEIIFSGVLFFFRFVVHQLFIKLIVFFVFGFIIFQLFFVFADFAIQFVDYQKRGFIEKNHPDQKQADRNGVFIQNIFLNEFKCFRFRLNVFDKFGSFHYINVFSESF